MWFRDDLSKLQQQRLGCIISNLPFPVLFLSCSKPALETFLPGLRRQHRPQNPGFSGIGAAARLAAGHTPLRPMWDWHEPRLLIGDITPNYARELLGRARCLVSRATFVLYLLPTPSPRLRLPKTILLPNRDQFACHFGSATHFQRFYFLFLVF